MKSLPCIGAIGALALLTQAAFADNDLALFLTKAKYESESLDTGFKLQYHHYFDDHMGIELAHGNYGQYERFDWYNDSTTSQDVKATNIGFVLKSERKDATSVFGKLGASHWSLGSGYSDTNGYLGFGVNFYSSDASVFVIEYEKINADSLDVSSLNIGVGGSF